MVMGEGAINPIENAVLASYNWADSLLTPLFGGGADVIILAFLFSLFCIFVWAFYKSISDKNLFNLDLNQYNKSKHPTAHKFFAAVLYFIEYLLIAPLLVVVWIFCLSLMILFLANERSITQILVISGAVIISIRIFAYTNKELAKEMAKLFPFVLISTFVLSSSAFNPELAASKINSISGLINDLPFYLLAVFVVEAVMRLVYTLILLVRGRKEPGNKNNLLIVSKGVKI
jgi:hypothetical protein